MKPSTVSSDAKTSTPVAWVGLDWADQKHVVCLYDVASDRRETTSLPQSPESLQGWLAELRARYGGARVAVVLEQFRGAVIAALLGCEFVVLYRINPQALASYRQALFPSGAKSDPSDAPLLLELVRKNPERFHSWAPTTPTPALWLC